MPTTSAALSASAKKTIKDTFLKLYDENYDLGDAALRVTLDDYVDAWLESSAAREDPTLGVHAQYTSVKGELFSAFMVRLNGARINSDDDTVKDLEISSIILSHSQMVPKLFEIIRGSVNKKVADQIKADFDKIEGRDGLEYGAGKLKELRSEEKLGKVYAQSKAVLLETKTKLQGDLDDLSVQDRAGQPGQDISARITALDTEIASYTTKANTIAQDIRDFHAGTTGRAGYDYGTSQLATLQSSATTLDDLIKAHQGVLAKAKTAAEVALKTAEKALAETDWGVKLAAHENARVAAQKLAEDTARTAAESTPDTPYDASKVTIDWTARTPTAAEQAEFAAYNALKSSSVDTAQTKLTTLTTTLETEVGKIETARTDVQDGHVAEDTFGIKHSAKVVEALGGASGVEQLDDYVTALKAAKVKFQTELDTIPSSSATTDQLARKAQINTHVETIDSKLTWASQYENKVDTFKSKVIKHGATSLSLADSLINASLVWDDPSNPVAKQIGSGFSVAGAAAGALEAALDGMSLPKAAKGATVAGAVATLAAGSTSLAVLAEALDNPDLNDSERAFLEAEIGIQGFSLSLGLLETGLTIANIAVQAGTRAASVLSTAIPVVGAIGAVVGAFNPVKWNEFEKADDHVDDVRDSGTYSSGLLADLLEETNDAKKAFYGVGTGVATGSAIAGAAISASGIGAPIGAIVSLIGGVVSGIIQAFEQTAIEELADKYADKMRTGADGQARTIEEYFQGSFDEQQNKTQKAYQGYFDALLKSADYSSVIALGSQTLHQNDLELAGFTKTAPELGKTAAHYAAEFKTSTTGGVWSESEIEFESKAGDDQINIPVQGAGGRPYVTFLTPLMASGEEILTEEVWTKKKTVTSLKIEDLAGWIIKDGAGNSSAFDLSKVVTQAQEGNLDNDAKIENLKNVYSDLARKKGGSDPETKAAKVAYEAEKNKKLQDKQIKITVDAGDGDDTVFFHEGAAIYKGGAGTDIASYIKIEERIISRGVLFSSNDDGTITATKQLGAGSKFYQESIESHTTTANKRTTVVEYRSMTLHETVGNKLVEDKIAGVEIIHGSRGNDVFSLADDATALRLFGFDGDDYIMGGDNIKIISGGTGDDIISLTDAAMQRAAKGLDADDAVFIDGGAGVDVLQLAETQQKTAMERFETKLVRDQLAKKMALSLLPLSSADYVAESERLSSSLSKILEKGADDTNRVDVLNIEYVGFDLVESKAAKAGLGIGNFYVLSEYATAAELMFNSFDSETFKEIDFGVAVSAADFDHGVGVLGSHGKDRIIGSDHADLIMGEEGDDLIIGGDGYDLLVGGEGADTFRFSSDKSGWSLLSKPMEVDESKDVIELKLNEADYDAVKSGSRFFRDYDDLLIKIGANGGVVVADYFKGTSVYLPLDALGHNHDESPIRFADINGDGRLDMVRTGVGGVEVSLQIKTGVNAGRFASKFTPTTEFTDGYGAQADFPTVFGDFNGDGRDDIIGFKEKSAHSAYGQANGTFTAAVANYAGFSKVSLQENTTMADFAVGDITGNGRDDLIGMSADTSTLLHSISTTNTLQYRSIALQGVLGSNQNYKGVAIGSITGEAKDHALFHHYDAVSKVHTFTDYEHKEINYYGPTYYWDDLEILTVNDMDEDTTMELADMNGDGHDDLVLFHKDGVSVHLGSATEDTYGNKTATLSTTSTLLTDKFSEEDGYYGDGTQSLQIADLDGDGKAEIIGMTEHNIEVATRQTDGTYKISDMQQLGTGGSRTLQLHVENVENGETQELSAAAVRQMTTKTPQLFDIYDLYMQKTSTSATKKGWATTEMRDLLGENGLTSLVKINADADGGTLNSLPGIDDLYAGAGADHFIMHPNTITNPSTSADFIHGFDKTADKIEFRGFDDIKDNDDIRDNFVYDASQNILTINKDSDSQSFVAIYTTDSLEALITADVFSFS